MIVRVFLAALAGAVASFLLGWLIYGYLLSGFASANMTPYEGLWIDPPNLVGIFLSGFVTSFLLAYIFVKWANISTFMPGLMAGAVIGFLILLSYDLYFWSTMNLFSVKYLAMDLGIGTLFNAFIGGIIATVLGMKRG